MLLYTVSLKSENYTSSPQKYKRRLKTMKQKPKLPPLYGELNNNVQSY